MQQAEERLFATGADPEPLMDRAGEGIARQIDHLFPETGTIIVYVGPGHNGGDALVAAHHLAEMGWGIELRLIAREKFKPLTEKKLNWLQTVPPKEGQLILLDGLLGIGARGPLRGEFATAAAEINQLRLEKFAHTIAIDIPTGLDGDTGEPHPGAVIADYTITIAHPKTGLLADTATNHVGRLSLIPLDEIEPTEGDPEATLIQPRHLAKTLPRRDFDTHKGMAGRVGIIAGSRGLTGAAVLTSTAAIRGGAGLVTLYVAEEIYPIIATTTLPEVMVRPIKSYQEVAGEKLDVLAIGPGLGTEHSKEILNLISNAQHPCVLDADALNMIAETGTAFLDQCQAPLLLTPHPGEMQRLAPQKNRTRRQWAEDFVERHPDITLLLKGARTIIKTKNHPAAHNPTGHPGMATGGIGDTLTGLTAALIAQGQTLHNAATTASYLTGRAAELALKTQSQESFRATDTLKHLGQSFKELKQHPNQQFK